MMIRVPPYHASPLALLLPLLLLSLASCNKPARGEAAGSKAAPPAGAEATVPKAAELSPEDAKKLDRMRYELEAAEARIASLKQDIAGYGVSDDSDLTSEDLTEALKSSRGKKAYLEHNLGKIDRETRRYEKALETQRK